MGKARRARHAVAISAVSFSNDARRLASVSDDELLRVWSIEDATCLQVFGGHTFCVLDCMWSAGDRFILSSGEYDNLRIWNVQTGMEMDSIEAACCKFRADPSMGSYIATQSTDKLVEWRTTGRLGPELHKKFFMLARCPEPVFQAVTDGTDHVDMLRALRRAGSIAAIAFNICAMLSCVCESQSYSMRFTFVWFVPLGFVPG